VSNQAVTEADLARLVDHMFELVLDESERRELLMWIREWESANPDVDSAHRVTGWIDVAYNFQARADRRVEAVRMGKIRTRQVAAWNPGVWPTASTA
jgi:hypothetical protein